MEFENKEYKCLAGILKKFIQYNCQWKNALVYTTSFFRCIKYLKYQIGLKTMVVEDADLEELKILEIKTRANNIDLKVNKTVENLLNQNPTLNPEFKKKIITMIAKAKADSDDFINNTNMEEFEKYGFKKLVDNK